MATDVKTIGPRAASALLGISEQLIRYRANTGRLKIARKTPLRFHIADVLNAIPTAKIKDRRGRRPLSELERLVS